MQFSLYKMDHSIEPKERRYVKGYGFLSFTKTIGKNISNKYGQKLVNTARKFATDAITTASKRAIQKTAEATGDLVGNKIANKITSVSKEVLSRKSLKKACDEKLPSNEVNKEIAKERYISKRKTTNY